MTLIERIEAATEPSRELDAEIACTLRIGPNLPDWALNWRGEWTPTIQGSAVLRHDDGSPGPHFVAPAYTASIDAALTLVPDQHIAGVIYHAQKRIQETGFPNSAYKHRLICEILAAALRARSSTHDAA